VTGIRVALSLTKPSHLPHASLTFNCLHRVNGREQITVDMSAEEVVAMQKTFDEI
jgi:hypothetical protein